MIIDLHRHLWSMFERYPVVRELAARGGVAGQHAHSAVPVLDVDTRAAEIRTEMAKAGVDRSCLLLGDYGLRLGEGDRTVEEENRLATDLAAADPEHFIAFFGVDPVCRPLYALARERGVPVAVHTGPLAAPLFSTYASPLEIDEPAADFPDVDFVILHAGQRAWFDLALDMARWKPNLYLELSLWQGLLLEDEARFVARVAEIKAGIGLGRVVFGSDCPGASATIPLDAWVDAWRELPATAARHGASITDGEVEQMLGGTASTLLEIA